MPTVNNNIIFNYVKMKNFLSVGPELIFDHRKYNGLNYVFGRNKDESEDVKNGVGKTCIFIDALLFGLFGRTSKRINKPNMINRAAGRGAEVELSISINDDLYVMTNTVKPTALKLLKNGKDITKSSIKETQDFIEKEVVKTTYDVFKNSILLSVTDTVSIFDMSKSDKCEFIERIFNLSVFGNMFTLVKTDLKTLEREIAQNTTDYNRIEKDLVEFQTQLTTFAQDKETRLKAIQDKIEEVDLKIGTYISEDTDVEALANLTEELKNLQDKQTKLTEAEKHLKGAATDVTNKLHYSNASVDKHSAILEIICGCTECYPKVNDRLGISVLHDQITSLTDELSINTTKQERIRAGNTIIAEGIFAAKKKITESKERLAKNIANEREIEFLKAKKNDLLDYLEIEKSKTSPFEELIEKYTTDKEDLYTQLAAQIGSRKYLAYMTYALSEDGVKRYIISKLINVLNNRIRKYLDILGADNFTVIFNPNFDVMFLTTSGECEYGNFSAGEKRRVDIATIFAFRDILCGQGTLLSSVLVADELLDVSIDQTAVDGVIEILKTEADKGRTIFVISHRECVEELQNDFNNIIELEKQGGFTRIVSDPS